MTSKDMENINTITTNIIIANEDKFLEFVFSKTKNEKEQKAYIQSYMANLGVRIAIHCCSDSNGDVDVEKVDKICDGFANVITKVTGCKNKLQE